MDRAIEFIDEGLDDTAIVFPLTEAEARSITSEIRENLRKCRKMVLRMAEEEGWRLLGYESFQAWAQGEFDISWQQVYNIKAAAEFDQELSLHSPSGEIYQIPVNHAKELRKLNKPESRVQAYQRAEQQAKAQGKATPTQEIVEQAVQTLKAEETVLESPYKVVRQALAEGTLSASQAKQITLELDRLSDERAQAFVQKWMVIFGLSNPDLIYPIGHRFAFECRGGKRSKVLDEVEATKGRLAGTPLSRATLHDWNRACAQAQAQHIADSQEQKRLQMIADGKPLPQQFALTLWKYDPAKTFKELVRHFEHDDLEEVFGLMARQFGYTQTEAMGELIAHTSLPDAANLNFDSPNDLIRDEVEYQVLLRVKPKEEKEELHRTEDRGSHINI